MHTRFTKPTGVVEEECRSPKKEQEDAKPLARCEEEMKKKGQNIGNVTRDRKCKMQKNKLMEK